LKINKSSFLNNILSKRRETDIKAKYNVNIVTSEKFIIFSFFSFLVFLFLGGCSSPVPSGEEYGVIDVLADPVQIPHDEGGIIIKGEEDCSYTLTPVARYKIAAVVVGKEFYSLGWQAQVAPVDVVLVWGKMAEPGYDRYITYSQSDRWYHYQYEPDSPFTNYYVRTHSSNNHIIPANDNIFKAIKTIRKREKITLEGYLVNVNSSHKGETFWWNSSVTRSDTGDGSCEVIYVTKIRIGNQIYE